MPLQDKHKFTEVCPVAALLRSRGQRSGKQLGTGSGKGSGPFMRGLGAAQRSVLALARSVQGGLSGRGMASGAAGPVHTAIVRAVTEALEPVEVELVDDSASHAGHSGMKGRQAVEVRCPAGRVRVAPVSAHARVRACPGACQGTLRRAPPSTADERGLRACCWHSPTSSCGSSPRSLRACP